MTQLGVPKYFLYGESAQDVDERFLHVESIAERSRLHDWYIRPHAHKDLQHLLLVTHRGGIACAEGGQVRFRAPALIRIPQAYVHGFRFQPGTDGWVVTASASLLGRIARDHPELTPVFSDAAATDLAPDAPDTADLRRLFDALVEEFRGHLPARRAAVECRLISIHIAALRLALRSTVTARPLRRNADSELLARFRALVEERYKTAAGIADYARQLRVSQERLRLACARVGGASPLALVNQRRLLEAKRGLLYTNMTVSQVGYSCGFDDPAYFSRFFARHTGQSARHFRLSRQPGLKRRPEP